MALRSPSFKKGERVIHDDFAAEILEVHTTKLTIRNKFGFREEIPRKGTQYAPEDKQPKTAKI